LFFQKKKKKKKLEEKMDELWRKNILLKENRRYAFGCQKNERQEQQFLEIPVLFTLNFIQ